MAGQAEHDFRSSRSTLGCMTGEVVGTDISLGLHDAGPELPPAQAPDENLAEQVRGQLDRRPAKEWMAKLF